MSIIEAANGTSRTERDEEGSNSWEQAAAKLSKNSRFPLLYMLGSGKCRQMANDFREAK